MAVTGKRTDGKNERHEPGAWRRSQGSSIMARMAERYADYDPFAWVYNRHWGNVFTPVALEIADRVLLPWLKAGASILDLCCGTGQMAALLCQRGFAVTGLDGSAEMLRFARRNAKAATFILADARSFSTVSRFDAVTCMFDSLNHVMSIEDLTSVFHAVYSALEEGGLFLFDFTTEAHHLREGGFYGIVEDDHVCVHESRYDPVTMTVDYGFTLFRLQCGEWRRSDFTLQQMSYEAEEVREAVREAGLTEVAAYGYERQEGLQELTPGSGRVVFLCRKPSR